MTTSLRLRTAAAGLAALGLLAACTSSSSTDSSGGTTSTGAASAADGAKRTCAVAPTDAPSVAAVAGSPSDRELVSFDGAKIRLHWFPTESGAPAPTILDGPGWGMGGDTNVASTGAGLFGNIGIGGLRAAGYNVLTWDPRGFGASTGTITVNSPEYEGRDVRRMIDWLATRPEVRLDAKGDPRLGMIGGSYGGGIQFVTAGLDCRVDAITPVIAWNSLGTSLFKADTYKSGWGNFLYGLAPKTALAREVIDGHDNGEATGRISDHVRQWFLDRGPGDELVGKITVPTLIVQGTVDTLFTPDEAIRNYRVLQRAGVPVAMLWFCGGHGVCLTDAGDTTRSGTAIRQWLDRYVMGKNDTAVLSGFETVDQLGHTWVASGFPADGTGSTLTAKGSGTLDLRADGGAGPAAPPKGDAGIIGSAALGLTPGRATNAVEVTATATTTGIVLGPPTLEFTYSGAAPTDVTRPTRVFAQLVDPTDDRVLGNQITPIAITLDGKEHTVDVPLESVAFAVTPGAKLVLQLVASTTAYAQPALGGSVEFSAITLTLPLPAGLTAR